MRTSRQAISEEFCRAFGVPVHNVYRVQFDQVANEWPTVTFHCHAVDRDGNFVIEDDELVTEIKQYGKGEQ